MLNTGSTRQASYKNWMQSRIEFQKQQKERQNAVNDKRNEEEANELFSCSLTSTDEPTIRRYTTASRMKELANGMRKWREETFGKRISEGVSDSDIICTYINGYPTKKDDIMNYLGGKDDLEGISNKLGFVKPATTTEGESSSTSTDENLGMGVAALGGVAGLLGTTYAGAKALDSAGLYRSTFDNTMDRARQAQQITANKQKLKSYDEAIKKQESLLSKAKQAGEGVEEAQAKLDYLKSQREFANARSQKIVRDIVDTAADYNLAGWSKSSIGDKAKAKGEFMFETEILPALKNSKQTININELIDSIDIEDLAKKDPDKLQAYRDALESLKESYSDPSFSKYSLENAQTLKSGLQGRTPQKFYKGKEVTNELSELKGILGSKIKDSLHEKLTAELGENSAKKYLDYSNLMEIAKQGVKDAAGAKSRQGFGSWTSFVKDKLRTRISSGVGLASKKIVNWTEDAVKNVAKAGKDSLVNGVKALIKNPKSLKALIDPAALIFPDGRDMTKDADKIILIDLINARANGEGPFAGKTEEEMDKILPMATIRATLQDKEFRDYLMANGIDMDIYDDILTEE